MLKLLWAMKIFLWLLKQLINLSQQANLSYLVSLQHIVLTELAWTWILACIKEDISSKLLNISYIASDIECLGIEINLRKVKGIIICLYNQHKNYISNHLENLSKVLNRHLSQYERSLCIGEFNSEIIKVALKHFCHIYHLKNQGNVPTCYKNLLKPSCINLFLTNCSRSFQDSHVKETGLSDFDKMNTTFLKMFWANRGMRPAFFKIIKLLIILPLEDRLIDNYWNMI